MYFMIFKSLTFVGLHTVIVVFGFPLKCATMILFVIFSILFNAFYEFLIRRIPISPMVAYMQFFKAEHVISLKSLILCSLISTSGYIIRCSWILTTSCLVVIGDKNNSGIFPSLFRVWTFNIEICSFFFPFSWPVFGFDSVANYSTATWVGFAGCAPCSARREMLDDICVGIYVISCFLWLVTCAVATPYTW